MGLVEDGFPATPFTRSGFGSDIGSYLLLCGKGSLEAVDCDGSGLSGSGSSSYSSSSSIASPPRNDRSIGLIAGTIESLNLGGFGGVRLVFCSTISTGGGGGVVLAPSSGGELPLLAWAAWRRSILFAPSDPGIGAEFTGFLVKTFLFAVPRVACMDDWCRGMEWKVGGVLFEGTIGEELKFGVVVYLKVPKLLMSF